MGSFLRHDIEKELEANFTSSCSPRLLMSGCLRVGFSLKPKREIARLVVLQVDSSTSFPYGFGIANNMWMPSAARGFA